MEIKDWTGAKLVWEDISEQIEKKESKDLMIKRDSLLNNPDIIPRH